PGKESRGARQRRFSPTLRSSSLGGTPALPNFPHLLEQQYYEPSQSFDGDLVLRNHRTMTAGVAIIFAAILGAHAQQPLSGHVELTRNGHRLKNESEAVAWLTPVGAKVDPPHQNPAEVPKLVQRDKSFRPDLLVIPVGGKVEFPNNDPFFHNVFSLFEGKRFDLGMYESGTTRFVQ